MIYNDKFYIGIKKDTGDKKWKESLFL
jgi:hypothetical protein